MPNEPTSKIAGEVGDFHLVEIDACFELDLEACTKSATRVRAADEGKADRRLVLVREVGGVLDLVGGGVVARTVTFPNQKRLGYKDFCPLLTRWDAYPLP